MDEQAEAERTQGQELAVPAQLLDVRTGELLPATTENAARVLDEARAMKVRIQDVIWAATLYLQEQSRIQGTKTFHVPGGPTVVLKGGGERIDYDPETLEQLLRESGLPEDRIREAVVETVSYKVDKRVLRQLVGANEDYRAAAELAEVRVPESVSASVKP